MSKIAIGYANGTTVAFDLQTLLRSRLLIQADSGGGKSWVIRVLCEQAFGKVQVILIDPEGEFATLREKFDYVLVGPGGETPADPRSAALVARRLLELQASAVCDLYELKNHLRHQWVKLFLSSVIDAPKNLWHPVLIIVDEAHVYCPEKDESEAASAMIDLATRGRKRGFCAVFATQRLAKLDKDASSELQNRLIGPTFEDVNRKRAAEVLGILKSDEREFFKQIQLLEPGNFFALGRAISNDRILVKIREVETTHPEMGSTKHAVAVPPAPDKIKALLPKLADLPKEAEEKARTEADFRREIATLKATVTRLEKQQAAPKLITDSRLIQAEIRKATDPLIRQFSGWQKQALQVIEVFSKGTVPAFLNSIANASLPTAAAPIALPTAVHHPPSAVLARQESSQIPTLRVNPPDLATAASNGISPAQSRIIKAAAEFSAVGISDISRKWLAARAGASHKSSAFINNLSSLRSRGFIDYRNGSVLLTPTGSELAGPHSQPMTPEDMQTSCRKLLTPAQARIFDALLFTYPQALNRGDLASHAGASPTSSAFINNLSALRSAGMIDYGPDSTVFMQKWIFLD